MISNLSIDKLKPHPNNPRKELGDLQELADSIKTNGIFQNLTVVPNEDDTYTVIIGHRRMAASKLAGLTELPCAIVEMSEKEQLGTMLLENMQRSDLTVYEQAQGFQMMIDLGESVEAIAEKTGFGKSTIYKRVKLCQLDKEEFKKAQERGATLEDYAKLDKINDPQLKNRALKDIGTANFDYAIRKAVEDEKHNAQVQKWETLLSTFATRKASVNISEYDLVQRVWMSDKEYNEFKVPADAETVEYFYTIGENSWDRDIIKIYKKDERNSLQRVSEAEERKKKEEERLLIKRKLRHLAVSFSKDRAEFIKCSVFSKTDIFDVVHVYALFTNSEWSPLDDYYYDKNIRSLCPLLNIEYTDELKKGDSFIDMVSNIPSFEEKMQEKPINFLLACMYINVEDVFGDSDKFIKTWNISNEYEALDSQKRKYLDLLVSLGYQMSEEERTLYDGTHELYLREESEEFLDVADMPEIEDIDD